ncbi:MAG: hypothetical protein MI700_12620, partial [Balneolales bacterium]|nr:hypothetical protein [Balneolales bacterium]
EVEIAEEQLKNEVTNNFNFMDPIDNCITQHDEIIAPVDEDECMEEDPGGGPGGNPGTGPGTGTSTGIKTGFHYTHKGQSTNRLYHAYSSSGTSWTGSNYRDITTSSNSLSNRGPSTVYFKNQLYAFYKGQNSDEISFTRSSNGTSWSSHQSIGGSSYKSHQAPAAVVYRDTLYVYYADDSNIRGVYTADGVNWNATGKLIQDKEIKRCASIVILINCFKPYAQFGVTVYNDQIVLMFPSDADGGQLKIRRSSDGKTFFQDFSLFPGIEPDKNKGVSGVEFNGKLFMTFGGRYTSNVKIVETDLVTVAQRDVTVSGGTPQTSQTPSIATDGSKLVIVYKGNSSSNVFYAYSTDGNAWSGNGFAVGGTKDGGPSLIYVN